MNSRTLASTNDCLAETPVGNVRADDLSASRRQFAGTVRPVGPGQALHLGRLGGELTVISGRIWLTRDGDLGDHLLESGQRLVLAIDDNAVIESWDAGAVANVRWNGRHQSLFAALLAEPLRVSAFLAGRLAAACAALAVRATSSARWAQGRIDGRSDAAAPARNT